ncbi:uncharacterized protein LOC134230230 [Saccostrea cucullata]|uniref:uncharacterized protein LOC134230230 n=1 Tax=Saccostrea cuccullata TaxID=36930 RepID=UPI002ED024ED
MYRQRFGTSSRIFIIFIIATSNVYVRAQETNTCNQMCREEKKYCTKDCDMPRLRHESDQCKGQCNEDMLYCLDRCNNMVELTHNIPVRNVALVKSDVPSEKQQNAKPLFPNVFDVNFVKLSSEKIFDSHPPTTNIPPSTSVNPSTTNIPLSTRVNVDKNQSEVTENSKKCVAQCTSKESECEVECLIAYHANNFQDSDCSSGCERNKNICIKNCEAERNEPRRTEEDIVVAVPGQVSNLRIPSLSLEREISVLEKILMGLPSSGTQMIGKWVL